MGDALKKLVAARGQAKGFMTRLRAYINNIDPDDKEVIDTVEAAYFEMAAYLNSQLMPIGVDSTLARPAQEAGYGGYQRLPRIEIKKFNGERTGLRHWKPLPRRNPQQREAA
ncbi:uncharacterized protein LOC125231598 [Leguminivora glycinivorella]|uniref:uncharacterized protein LOC125231598 n=1 Tax=Leguminivora glycinivorella TaxID=1035111 RepID=UPI00200BBFA1|nr:uncharacterized protein LOC125231598 [Leguminivora glycinivorella]